MGKTHGHHIVLVVRRALIKDGQHQLVHDHLYVLIACHRIVLDDLLQHFRLVRVKEFQKPQEQQNIVFIFVIVHTATSEEDTAA